MPSSNQSKRSNIILDALRYLLPSSWLPRPQIEETPIITENQLRTPQYFSRDYWGYKTLLNTLGRGTRYVYDGVAYFGSARGEYFKIQAEPDGGLILTPVYYNYLHRATSPGWNIAVPYEVKNTLPPDIRWEGTCCGKQFYVDTYRCLYEKLESGQYVYWGTVDVGADYRPIKLPVGNSWSVIDYPDRYISYTSHEYQSHLRGRNYNFIAIDDPVLYGTSLGLDESGRIKTTTVKPKVPINKNKRKKSKGLP